MISAKNQIALKKIQESKELLSILKTIETETDLLEALMVERLKLFFTELESQVLELVEGNELLLIKLHGLVDNLIADNFEDYYEIISKYNKKAWEHGQATTSLLVAHAEVSLKHFSLKANVIVDTDDLFKPSTTVNEIISTRSFEASEKTMQRVNGNINKVLQDSYNEGWGVPKITANLKNEFNKLKTWESRRIARTEINSAQNTAAYLQLIDDDIGYHQWWSANDNQVRDSHNEMHGLITKVGNPFPNGLLYPGDRSGPISEWVNCRCTPLAFIVPYDMMVPPGMSVFRESDLIPVDDQLRNANRDLRPKRDIISESNFIDNKYPDEFSKETIRYIEKFNKSTIGKKVEHGQIFNYKTGKTTSPKFKGNEGSVNIKEWEWNWDHHKPKLEQMKAALKDPEKYKKYFIKDNNLATIHNHPSTGLRAPSPADFKTQMLNEWEDYGIAISKKETWIIEARGKFSTVDAYNVEKNTEKLYNKAVDKVRKEMLSERYIKKSLNERSKIREELLNKEYSESLQKYIKDSNLNINIRRIVN